MIGTKVSHYRILERIGSGGMGVVYKARDLELDRYVSLKFLPPGSEQEDESRERFVQEAKAASALDHPNICTVYEIGESEQGQAFIAMAHYEGATLKSLLSADDRGELPSIADAVGYAMQIAEGLAASHAKGIIHRDIKPENLLLTDAGLIKILDFGVAKLSGQTGLTRTGSTIGTVAYMSPEQAGGGSVDQRADLWALGVVLFELAAGQRPFRGESAPELFSAILNQPAPALSELCPEAPPGLGRIVARCLEKNPERRYFSAELLLTELRQLQRELEQSWRPTESLPLPADRRRPVLRPLRHLSKVAAVLVLLGLIAVSLYLAMRAPGLQHEPVPLAIADFVNETGERELDGLSGMLITALEQSRRLSVLSRSRMFDVLKQLQQTEFERIDEELLRRIGEHAEIDLLALPTVRKFGELYTLDLKVVDRRTGRHLLAADSEGRGIESIPTLINDLAEETRKGLRERESEIALSSQDVARVTTPDLQAYKHFFEGEELLDRVDQVEAIGEFERAVELDPSFGLAWYRLGYAEHMRGENERARKALDRALELLDRMPEKERFLARAYSAHLGHSEEELEAGLTILREMEQRYPGSKEMLFFIGDWSYHNRHYDTARRYLERVLEMDPSFQRGLWHLALLNRDTGRYHEMLETARRYKALGESAAACHLLGAAQARLGRLDEARRNLERSLALEEDPFTYWELAFVRLEQGGAAAAEELGRTTLERHPSLPWSYYALAEILLRRQRVEAAAALAREYLASGEGFHGLNLLARVLVVGGLDTAEGLRLAEQAVERKPPRYRDRTRTMFFYPVVEHTLGLGYLEQGQPEQAVKLLERAYALAPLRPEIQQALERTKSAAAPEQLAPAPPAGV